MKMDNSKLTIIAVILCSAWAVLAMAEGPTDPLSSLSGVLMRIRRISRQLERGTRKRDVGRCQLVQELIATMKELNKTLTDDYPKDCRDAYQKNCTMSGIYLVKPDQQAPFHVYCNMDRPLDGKRGWAVIQRRQNGTENFNRGWSEYREGFGDLNGEFWLGLEKIYRLTASAQDTNLYIDMTDLDNEDSYVYYGSFTLGPASTNYSLTLSGYAGTTPDAYNECANVSFVSFDNHINETGATNCTEGKTGGWWSSVMEDGHICGSANLNGLYPNMTFSDCFDNVDSCTDTNSLIHWRSESGRCRQIRKKSEMMLFISHK